MNVSSVFKHIAFHCHSNGESKESPVLQVRGDEEASDHCDGTQ